MTAEEKAFKKIRAQTAREVLDRYELGPTLSAHLVEHPVLPELTPAEFIEQLKAGLLWSDLIVFLAHALPRREAVWWACVVARKVVAQEPVMAGDALSAAEAWVKEPSEAHRRKAEVCAKLSAHEYAASWAAQAAFWANGSITGPNDPPVAPPKYLYAQAVNGAMALALGQAQIQMSQAESAPMLTEAEVVNMGLRLAAGRSLAA